MKRVNVATTALGIVIGLLASSVAWANTIVADGTAVELPKEPAPVEVKVAWEQVEVIKYEPVVLDEARIILPEDVAELEGFERDACLLAKMAWGEARGMSTYERSLTMWCVLNRVDNERYPNSVEAVVTAPYQFVGYKASNPIDKELYELAKDVLARWYAEKNCIGSVGRTLPNDYLYFYGDGQHNKFRKTNSGVGRYDFTDTNPNPYQ